MRWMLVGAAIALSACATRGEEVDHFAYAAATPLRDMNLVRDRIPPQLRALQDPFGYTESTGCRAWATEIGQLQQALTTQAGQPVGYRRDARTWTGLSGNVRDVTVASVAGSVLPYRGVVRQLSGAAAHAQRAQVDGQRARYRIGYLVGMGRAHRCPGF